VSESRKNRESKVKFFGSKWLYSAAGRGFGATGENIREVEADRASILQIKRDDFPGKIVSNGELFRGLVAVPQNRRREWAIFDLGEGFRDIGYTKFAAEVSQYGRKLVFTALKWPIGEGLLAAAITDRIRLGEAFRDPCARDLVLVGFVARPVR
jgi:hypothetical protein